MRRERLETTDRLNLAVETPDHPVNMGAVALLDAAALLDAGGHLPLTALRDRIARRLPMVPRLQQVVTASHTFGRPLWTEGPALRIDYHVNHLELPAPADEQGLLRLAAELMSTVLDRSRPLWRMWFVTGLAGDRSAVVLVMHHVVTDGLGAVKALTTLFGDGDGCQVPRVVAAQGEPLRSRRTVGTVTAAVRTFRRFRNAPRTTFNHPVGRHRLLAVLRLDLATVKQVAHHHGGKVNDVVLALAAAALRDLMRDRGELAGPVRLHASVAASLRDGGHATAAGNRTGGYVVHLPVWVSDPATRLRLISADSALAKRTQSPLAGNMLLDMLARLGLIGWMSRHQRFTNLLESDITGPVDPITLLGMPVRQLIPIGVLTGNLSIAFLALSYAGCLVISVQADAELFPSLSPIIAAAQREWSALCHTAGVSATSA